MDTLLEYSEGIRFMFMRVNARIVNVGIYRTFGCFVPPDAKMVIFNELGLTTDRDNVSISPESAETLIGLLTTLGIKYTQSTGN